MGKAVEHTTTRPGRKEEVQIEFQTKLEEAAQYPLERLRAELRKQIFDLGPPWSTYEYCVKVGEPLAKASEEVFGWCAPTRQQSGVPFYFGHCIDEGIEYVGRKYSLTSQGDGFSPILFYLATTSAGNGHHPTSRGKVVPIRPSKDQDLPAPLKQLLESNQAAAEGFFALVKATVDTADFIGRNDLHKAFRRMFGVELPTDVVQARVLDLVRGGLLLKQGHSDHQFVLGNPANAWLTKLNIAKGDADVQPKPITAGQVVQLPPEKIEHVLNQLVNTVKQLQAKIAELSAAASDDSVVSKVLEEMAALSNDYAELQAKHDAKKEALAASEAEVAKLQEQLAAAEARAAQIPKVDPLAVAKALRAGVKLNSS